MATPAVTDLCQSSMDREEVQHRADRYVRLHDDRRAGVEERKAGYATMVNDYYDLATDFYEFGWGQSFHFAPRHKGESMQESLVRHEHFLALRLGLGPEMRVLDLGCGVGGPMRAIARFSGAYVVGVNNNDYQIKRGRSHTAQAGLSERCEFLKADFLHLPMADGSYDAAYAIEATCHAPDRRDVFREIFRTLRPGARFATYEWCLTDRFDGSNPDHVAMKKGIEEGNGLPDLIPTAEVLATLRDVGFEIVESADLAETSDRETPWYLPLDSGKWYTLSGFRSSPLGSWVTHQMVRVLEATRIAPKGTVSVSSFLQRGARALVVGGRAGTFTPMFYVLARKPG